MIVKRFSPWQKKEVEVDIPNLTPEQLAAYEANPREMLIQNRFPHLTPAEREFIKTGYTDQDWKEMFAPEEDDLDDPDDDSGPNA